jgi:type III secretion protein V
MGFALTHIKIREILLPLLTILVVAMIIFPIPAWMLDVLFAANFAFCIILLLSSLFISEPDRFTSLPSLLLLSTLFRLGLNISSTRLILSGVSVPDVIVAFGNFVVAGSTIVGLVVFSIISIIQFIVIAKGSERVAEVAARFTLDALPGKQMSIDADMRAGLLAMGEAREKRRELHRESKLYGALDGAMKFIKGDAIVGLCIIFVNILAGFIVGVTRDGLSLPDAVQQYTLLTIGDGLVSQIPAVLVSVAAGIVVTRVSENEGGMLSEEISTQLFREPNVLLISGIVLCLLGFVPGLPLLPFLGVSILPATYWIQGQKKSHTQTKKKVDYQFTPRVLPSLVIKLSAEGALLLQKEEGIAGYIEAIRADIFDSSGVLLPEVCFDIDPHQQYTSAELLIHAQSKGTMVFDSTQSEGNEKDPWSRLVGQLLRSQINRYLSEFVSDAHTRNLLDLYEPYNLDLINVLIPGKMSVTFLTLTLRELVEQKVSIRDFLSILQSLSEHFYYHEHTGHGLENQKSVADAVCSVRKRLVPKCIMQKFSDDEPLNVIVLDTDLEQKILTHCQAELSIHPDLVDELRDSLLKILPKEREPKKILLVHPSVLYAVTHTFKSLSNTILIFSYEEIPSGYKIKVEKTLSIESKDRYEVAA